MNYINKIFQLKMKGIITVFAFVNFHFLSVKSHAVTPMAYCVNVSGCEILNIKPAETKTDIKYCKAGQFKQLRLSHFVVTNTSNPAFNGYLFIKSSAQKLNLDCSLPYYCSCPDGEIKPSMSDISSLRCNNCAEKDFGNGLITCNWSCVAL